MESDEIARAIAEGLAQHLPTGALTDKSEVVLIAAMKYAVGVRQNLQVVVGQIAAELNSRGKTWRELGEHTGMDHVTLYRWAKPFKNNGPAK